MFESIQREFNIRYYKWALQDFQREIESGLPCLKKFNTGPLWHVKDMMSKMCSDEQLFFATALVKRFHQEAVRDIGDSISKEETQLCEEYLNRAMYPSPVSQAFESKLKAKGFPVYANRARLTRLVKGELNAIGLQPLELESGTRVMNFQSTIGEWQIITRIHTHEKHAQLAYDHAIWSTNRVMPILLGNGEKHMWPFQLRGNISFAGWLGACSRTEWRGIIDNNSKESVQILVDLIQHFLHAIPELLKGLELEKK